MVAGLLVNGCWVASDCWVVSLWLLGCLSMVSGLLVNGCCGFFCLASCRDLHTLLLAMVMALSLHWHRALVTRGSAGDSRCWRGERAMVNPT